MTTPFKYEKNTDDVLQKISTSAVGIFCKVRMASLIGELLSIHPFIYFNGVIDDSARGKISTMLLAPFSINQPKEGFRQLTVRIIYYEKMRGPDKAGLKIETHEPDIGHFTWTLAYSHYPTEEALNDLVKTIIAEVIEHWTNHPNLVIDKS